jgi:hypothetical protein
VVIAESTRRLLGNLFELEDLGARDLKGTAGPVRTRRVAIASISSAAEITPLHLRRLASLSLRQAKEGTVLESIWHRSARLDFYRDRKSIRCSSGDHLGDHFTPLNWSASL